MSDSIESNESFPVIDSKLTKSIVFHIAILLQVSNKLFVQVLRPIWLEFVVLPVLDEHLPNCVVYLASIFILALLLIDGDQGLTSPNSITVTDLWTKVDMNRTISKFGILEIVDT